MDYTCELTKEEMEDVEALRELMPILSKIKIIINKIKIRDRRKSWKKHKENNYGRKRMFR